MIANRLFLVCTHCPQQDKSLALGKRMESGYFRPPSTQQLQAWFDEHEHCGGDLDHYCVAFEKPKNWTQPLPAPPVETAVRLALVNGHPYD